MKSDWEEQFRLGQRVARGDPEALRQIEEEIERLRMRIDAHREAWGLKPTKPEKPSPPVEIAKYFAPGCPQATILGGAWPTSPDLDDDDRSSPDLAMPPNLALWLEQHVAAPSDLNEP